MAPEPTGLRLSESFGADSGSKTARAIKRLGARAVRVWSKSNMKNLVEASTGRGRE